MVAKGWEHVLLAACAWRTKSDVADGWQGERHQSESPSQTNTSNCFS